MPAAHSTHRLEPAFHARDLTPSRRRGRPPEVRHEKKYVVSGRPALLGAGLLGRLGRLGRLVIPNGLRPLPYTVLPELAGQHELRRRVEVPLPQRLLRARQVQVLLRLRRELVHHVDAEVVHDPHGLLRDADGGMGLLQDAIDVGAEVKPRRLRLRLPLLLRDFGSGDGSGGLGWWRCLLGRGGHDCLYIFVGWKRMCLWLRATTEVWSVVVCRFMVP